jgi:hypothetical protein
MNPMMPHLLAAVTVTALQRSQAEPDPLVWIAGVILVLLMYHRRQRAFRAYHSQRHTHHSH